MSKREISKVYEYTCDLCQATWTPDYWADNPAGGVVTVVDDGVNGRDARSWEHLCRSCRGEIQNAVDKVAVKRGGERWLERCKKKTESTGATNDKP